MNANVRMYKCALSKHIGVEIRLHKLARCFNFKIKKKIDFIKNVKYVEIQCFDGYKWLDRVSNSYLHWYRCTGQPVDCTVHYIHYRLASVFRNHMNGFGNVSFVHCHRFTHQDIGYKLQHDHKTKLLTIK